MRRLEHRMEPIPDADEEGMQSVDPERGAQMTTIQVTTEIRDRLREYSGRNYSERIINMDGMQTCSGAGSSGGCRKKANHAKWFNAGPGLFVAMPLCADCLKKCEIEHGAHVYDGADDATTADVEAAIETHDSSAGEVVADLDADETADE